MKVGESSTSATSTGRRLAVTSAAAVNFARSQGIFEGSTPLGAGDRIDRVDVRGGKVQRGRHHPLVQPIAGDVAGPMDVGGDGRLKLYVHFIVAAVHGQSELIAGLANLDPKAGHILAKARRAQQTGRNAPG